MGTRLNRDAYQRLINEDLAWLEKQPRSLEREHIKDIVRLSPSREYSNPATTPPDFTEHVHCWHERVDAASFCCGCEDLTYLHQAVDVQPTTTPPDFTEQAVTPEQIVLGTARLDNHFRKWLIEQLTAMGDGQLQWQPSPQYVASFTEQAQQRLSQHSSSAFLGFLGTEPFNELVAIMASFAAEAATQGQGGGD